MASHNDWMQYTEGYQVFHPKNMHEKTDIWNKKRVCIADDDPDLLEIYSKKFMMEGFEVISAMDGEAALSAIRQQLPDVVLLDLEMPRKNGLEVLQEMRADQTIAKIPVIILSNLDHEDIFSAAGRYETKFYLLKSMTTPQKAVEYVREVLQ